MNEAFILLYQGFQKITTEKQNRYSKLLHSEYVFERKKHVFRVFCSMQNIRHDR